MTRDHVINALSAVPVAQLAAWFSVAESDEAMRFIRLELARRIQAKAWQARRPGEQVLFDTEEEVQGIPMATLFEMAEP